MPLKFLLLFLILLTSGVAEAETSRILIDDFEDGLKSRWQPKVFSGETRYQVVPCQGGSCLQAESRGTASGLVYEIEFDPADYPLLSWRWKISNVLDKGDARTRAGDDYAARVYVIFPHWFFPKTRILNYIWANRLPKETIQPNAYTGNAMMIAVESGADRAGEWIVVERDLAADYRKAFGEEPPMAGAIAVMTDTDNTREAARSWYDDFVLRSVSRR